jgi:flagellar biosynthetic protein FliR
MVAFPLDTYLSGHVFAFLCIFARLGCVLMLMPGIGETYVPARVRLLIALSMSFLLMEPLLPRIPAPTENIGDLIKIISYEIVVGLFFGTMLRLIMSTLETTGTIIAVQIGLSNATVFNPSLGIQSPLPSAFLSVTATALIFITGLDHLLIRSIAALYDLFPPGGEFMPGDVVQAVIQMVNRSFVFGIELAMPFLVMGLLMYIALGLMQKLMPQVQLFLVVMPLQIWGGIAMLAITTAGIMAVWLQYFDTSVSSFFTR